jgi:hypothetical protein
VAAVSSASHSLDFKRRAAQQLLMGGHINEGLALIRSVLAAVGFTLPAGPKRSLWSFLLKRLQISLRGLNFTERDASEIAESELVRIDTCWAVAAGLGAVDLIRGADFQSRHLLLALRAGEPFRVARALAFEAAQVASRGGRGVERAEQIAHRAQAVAQKVGHPNAIGLSIWAEGVAAYFGGKWRRSAELCERAAEVLRDKCTGVTWELTIANRFMLSDLLHMGELAEVSHRVPALLAAALEQGNLFAAIDLRTRLNMIWLASDDPDKARAEVIAALTDWPQEGFHLQHYASLFALVQIELYTDDAEVALKHVEGQWQALKDSMLLRIQGIRIEAMHLRARALLATSLLDGDKDKLRRAEKFARRIAREKLSPWAKPLANLELAAVAHQRGQTQTASALLSAAIQGFEGAEMNLYAAASRRRLGETLGGAPGQQLVADADAWMSQQRIKNPEAMTRLLAPGFAGE